VVSRNVVQQLSFTFEEDISGTKLATKQRILGFGFRFYTLNGYNGIVPIHVEDLLLAVLMESDFPGRYADSIFLLSKII
jgi:hypothetical protein